MRNRPPPKEEKEEKLYRLSEKDNQRNIDESTPKKIGEKEEKSKNYQ